MHTAVHTYPAGLGATETGESVTKIGDSAFFFFSRRARLLAARASFAAKSSGAAEVSLPPVSEVAALPVLSVSDTTSGDRELRETCSKEGEGGREGVKSV